MSIQDENLLTEFVVESREHLSTIEPDLLILEKELEKAEDETINRIFRAIHSIKGAAGFFGLQNLKHLSHVMENLLMQIRDGKILPSTSIVDGLLAGVDKLNLMLNDIHASEEVNCEEEIQVLEASLQEALNPSVSPTEKTAKNVSASTGISAESPFQTNPDSAQEVAIQQSPSLHALAAMTIDREQISTIAGQGKHLYLLPCRPASGKTDQELKTLMGSMGVLLAEGEVEDQEFLLYCSVLEQELLAAALGLSENELELIDANTLQLKTTLNDNSGAAIAEAKAGTSVISKQNTQEAATPTIDNSLSTRAKVVKASTDNPSNLSKTEKSTVEGNETIRVRVELLNKLMNLAGEMVLVRNQLSRILKDEVGRLEGLSPIMQNLDLATTDLQEHIMQTRMQPIGNIFGKFPRIVRDLAKQLNKKIEIELFGEDVELDKTLIEALSDPLNHLIRNCCDHGLETPGVRKKCGKPETGTVTLKAFHEGGQINISITDDGKGIDLDRIAKKAIKAGHITADELESMNHRDIANLIFLPGLSTAEQVSDISGRGVGMDVVKTNIERLGGHISLDSEPGMGTSILLRLPLTLAIIPSLIVSVQEYRFAISQVNLVELICIKASEIAQRIERIGNASVLRLRGRLLPLVRLADILGLERKYYDESQAELRTDRREHLYDERRQAEKPSEKASSSKKNGDTAKRPANTVEERRQSIKDYYVVVLQVGNRQYGLIVDNVRDLEEIVVKPLSEFFRDCVCFNGATIMGDGKVALILDAAGILSAAKLTFADISAEEQRMKAEADDADKRLRQRQSVLLFKNAIDETFGIPLSSILRLEKFQTSDIETIGSKEFITYRGKGLPLIRLEKHLPVKPMPDGIQEFYVIIPKLGQDDEEAVAGIVSSSILDATETELEVDTHLIQTKGIQGSAIIQGQMTILIDAETIVKAAGCTQEQEKAYA